MKTTMKNSTKTLSETVYSGDSMETIKDESHRSQQSFFYTCSSEMIPRPVDYNQRNQKSHLQVQDTVGHLFVARFLGTLSTRT